MIHFEDLDLGFTHKRATSFVERKVEAGREVVEDVRADVADIQRRASDLVRQARNVTDQFGDLSRPPPILVALIKEFAGRQAVKDELRRHGEKVGDRIWDAAMGRLRNLVRKPPPSPPGPPEHGWVPDVVMPIVGPFADGVKGRLIVRSKPFVRLIVLGLAATHAGAFAVGRWLLPKR